MMFVMFVVVFFSFEYFGLFGDSFVVMYDQVMDYGIVVMEVVFQFSQGFGVVFDVYQNVVGFVYVVDGVGQLMMVLVFQMVDFVVVFFDGFGVMFDYVIDLFVLVGVNQEYDFVMMYKCFLWVVVCCRMVR